MISDSALRGDLPLNGLRHPPEAGTNGWFIWGGEYSTDPINQHAERDRCECRPQEPGEK
ncbi:immunity protein Imm33 domain-containing protein [Rhizobium leguminosarum]|uniref:immunity protein Imm33 domain-containing protein n=1 Tax=Rhizobium leguminosarum TaxID=384 RepID=UPI003D7C2D0D